MRTRKSSPTRKNRALKPRVTTDGAVGKKLPPRRASRARESSTDPCAPVKPADKSFPIVGVGASAGGFEAFAQLLGALPTNTGMAFVLVQHLDPNHESKLSILLSRVTALPVVEVEDGTQTQPDHIYVIPPNRNLAVLNGKLHLMLRSENDRQHLAVDYFFRSLAKDKKSKAIGVVLSGTGSDGALGLKAIKAEGGVTFAQDESAKYDGMPRSAVATDAVDYVLPPSKIARELARIGRHPYLTRFEEQTLEEVRPITGDALNKIFILLRAGTGVDFSSYKLATVRRRIARRLALHQIGTLKDYVKFLQDNPAEVKALFHDILISVTEFFRDQDTYEALRLKVFPGLMNNRQPDDPIRIWVPGCSTGEEPYSLAISLLSFLRDAGDASESTQVQVFATDINDLALDRARIGKYPESIASQMPPELLRKYFRKVEAGYQISKAVREIVIFARHDVTQDPPFSRMDIVSCRNLLIYLGPDLQKKVIPRFHYALKPAGFLVLGSSETIGGFPDLFGLVDKKQKIYSNKSTPSRIDIVPPSDAALRRNSAVIRSRISDRLQGGFQIHDEVDRILLTRYAPAGVVVNDQMDIIEVRGHVGPYLELPPGEMSYNLPKMAREGLALELRAAIQQARSNGTSVRREGLKVQSGDQIRRCNLEVIPITGQSAERWFAVLFEDVSGAPIVRSTQPTSGKGTNRKAKQTLQQLMFAQLEQELTSSKRDLQAVIEEMEEGNEDLRSANEEILSSNEELQSTNEELETAKEELQAANEELTTVNDELQNRNVDLNRANSDLLNLLVSINMPIVLLGKDLRIRRFTSQAERVLNVSSTDVGRPIGDVTPGIQIPDLERLLLEAIETVSVREREVQDAEGRWYSMQIRPYKTAEDKIAGAVLMLVDIDALKRSQDLADTLDTIREPFLILDTDLRVKSANRSFYQMFQVRREQTEGRLIYDLGNGQWDIPELRSLLEHILPEHTVFDDFEVEHTFPRIGRRLMLLNGRQIYREGKRPEGILLAIEDITERAGSR